MVARTVGTEDPEVDIAHPQLLTKRLSLSPHPELGFSIGRSGRAFRFLRHPGLMHSVLRLGAGKQEPPAAQRLCSPDRIQGGPQIFLLELLPGPGPASGSAPAKMTEGVAGALDLFCQKLRGGKVIFHNVQTPLP